MLKLANAAPASGPTVPARRAAVAKLRAKPLARAGFRFARPALARRRRLLGIERRALARQLAIPEVTLWKIERGHLRASPERQHALARELGASVEELFAPQLPRPDKPKRPRGVDAATVDAMEARYRDGASFETIGVEFGKAPSTVHYLLVERRGVAPRPCSVPDKHPARSLRTCERNGCHNLHAPTGYQVAKGEGRFCSRACHYADRQVAEPEERICARKGCKVRFTPHPSEVAKGKGRLCSDRCRGLALWDDEDKVAAFVASLRARGLFKTRAERAWGGAWPAKRQGRVAGKRPVEELFPELAADALDLQRAGRSLRDIAAETRLTKREVEGIFARAAMSP
jgi:transcriptional regulator with XRE-family HTH domain